MLDILFNLGPILISGQKVKVGAHDVAETQQINFYLFRFGGKVVPKGK